MVSSKKQVCWSLCSRAFLGETCNNYSESSHEFVVVILAFLDVVYTEKACMMA